MRSRRTWLFSALGAFLFTAHAGVAAAETAADKATAREAATEGIRLFRAGKYADALDRLKRAEALYDVPVHLLYIARCQNKLGQLVEAAESYRSIDHYELPPGAPEAWISAVNEGRKELAAIEPRVPSLRIIAVPANAPEPVLQIDGAPVAAAVIGIPRPINPGKHHVELAATGYANATADVDVAEATQKDLTLTLVAQSNPSAGANPGPAPAMDIRTATSSSNPTLFGFMFGLRLGGALPTGKILAYRDLSGNTSDLNVSDAFQPGGSLELHAGVRIAQYFTPVLYLEGETLASGSGFVGANDVKKTTATAVGLGLIIGTPPGRMGGFGEADVVFAQTFALTTTIGTKPDDCDLSATGAGLRFGGGGVFPVADWLQLTPFAMATIGRFTTTSASSGCSVLIPGGDIASGDMRTHAMVVLGVGGDVVLGKDRR